MEHNLPGVIVIGGSAGGFRAAMEILSGIASGLHVPVFLVLHSGKSSVSGMAQRLSATCSCETSIPENGDPVKPGRLYIAPPDHHLMLQEGVIRITHGPRVNRSRPAIDLLFRSAAVAYGSGVIGVLLSGMLYDGVSGLQAIGRCGGVTVVQDPDDALFGDLPAEALSQIDIHHRKPASGIGALLDNLVRNRVGNGHPIPPDLALENRIDLQNDGAESVLEQLGERVPVSCPDCGGQLWEMEMEGEGPPRYRCHTGHALSIHSLMDGRNEELEKTLWMALRALEEKVKVQEKLARSGGRADSSLIRESYREKAEETRQQAKRLREMLLELENPPAEPGSA